MQVYDPQPTLNSHCGAVLWLALDMPRRELKHPRQVEDWLLDLGRRLAQPGGLILIVSSICIVQLRSSLKVVCSPIRFLLACAISFLFIQIAVHGESIMGGTVRVFIIWILQLIIIRSLCLRQGFPLRFSLVMFVIGLIPLPYLTFQSTDVVERARVGIETGGLSHPGSLAEWFGFLTVYFALFGLETKRVVVRTTS